MPVLKTYPSPGQKVLLILNPGQSNEISFSSYIETILPNGGVVVSLPFHLAPHGIHEKRAIVLEYGKDDGFYRYDSIIEGVLKQERPHPDQIVIAAQPGPKKSQRRDFFRLNIALPFRYLAVTPPADYEPDSAVQRRCLLKWGQQIVGIEWFLKTEDIGGGGFCFLTHELWPAKDLHYFEIKLDENTLQVLGQVKYSNPVTDSEAEQYVVGINFVGLKLDEQDRLIAWIFKKQNEILRQKRQRE